MTFALHRGSHIATVNQERLGVLGAILAMDGRKPLVPSSGLAMQVGTASQSTISFMPANLQRALSKHLTVPVCGLSLARKKGAFLARKEGATAPKEARYATKYLDTTGTLGISIPDFDS